MSGSNPNPYFDMNWKQFEQFFGGKMPFPPQPGSGDTGPAAAAGDLSWVDGYIKDVLKKNDSADGSADVESSFSLGSVRYP